MNESEFRRKIHKHCSKTITWFPVENSMGNGMPDEFFHLTTPEGFYNGWIELKVVNSVDEKVKFQPGQISWLTRYLASGGNAFLLIHDNKTNRSLLVLENFHLFKDRTIKSVLDCGTMKNSMDWLPFKVERKIFPHLEHKLTSECRGY